MMGKSLEHMNCKVKKRDGRPPPSPAVDMDRR